MREVDDDTYLMSISEWKEAVSCGMFNEYDGSGAWVKDGKYMTEKVFDDVFSKPPEGATHVAWFNK